MFISYTAKIQKIYLKAKKKRKNILFYWKFNIYL